MCIAVVNLRPIYSGEKHTAKRYSIYLSKDEALSKALETIDLSCVLHTETNVFHKRAEHPAEWNSAT